MVAPNSSLVSKYLLVHNDSLGGQITEAVNIANFRGPALMNRRGELGGIRIDRQKHRRWGQTTRTKTRTARRCPCPTSWCWWRWRQWCKLGGLAQRGQGVVEGALVRNSSSGSKMGRKLVRRSPGAKEERWRERYFLGVVRWWKFYNNIIMYFVSCFVGFIVSAWHGLMPKVLAK